MAYRRWGALVYTMALRGTDDAASARDITAAAFAEAWRPGLSAEELKVALTAAVRRATLAARSAGARSAGARSAAAGTDHAEQQLPSMDDAETSALLDRLVVRDDLTDLGDPDRTVMLRLINADEGRRAIAERLGLDPDQVAAIIARSLRTMRDRLAGSRAGY